MEALYSRLAVINSLIVDLPAATNLSYAWNFGSLLGFILVLQVITGILLAMHYTPHISLAFFSLEHIMRDVQLGWLLRYLHSNGASLFFLAVYLHIARGIFFGSFNTPRKTLWTIGVVIYILMMATAFIGYVLPWGQMSLWGATVITNMFSAIPYVGTDLVYWIWGGFSVDNATLNRFFSLHYLLPFLLITLSIFHLNALHAHGSSNPKGLDANVEKIPFHPYYSLKDVLGIILLVALLVVLLFFFPDALGHPDNYIPANPLVTPPHIVPEWYFLFAYAILRSIPSKLGGVVALASSLLILFVLPFLHLSPIRSSQLRPFATFFFAIFFFNFLFLTWLGGNPVQEPYVVLGQIATFVYFAYFLIIYPVLTWCEAQFYHFH